MKIENDLKHCKGNQKGSATGNTYIRWGRTDCPSKTGARVVYDGYAAGSWYDNTGGGSDYLCLPRDPELVDMRGGARSYMYGAEFTYSPGSTLTKMAHQDVLCVVCYTPNTNVVMVPA